MFRFCFISGLPTAIPPDLARTGKHLIALYEQLDAKSLTHAFVEKPEQREDLVTEAGAGRILRRVRGAVREKRPVALCMYTRVAHHTIQHENVGEEDQKAEVKKHYELVNVYH